MVEIGRNGGRARRRNKNGDSANSVGGGDISNARPGVEQVMPRHDPEASGPGSGGGSA